MAEQLDFSIQDSDEESDEVILTPAELIERLEQVSGTQKQPGPFLSLLGFLLFLVPLCADVGN